MSLALLAVGALAQNWIPGPFAGPGFSNGPTPYRPAVWDPIRQQVVCFSLNTTTSTWVWDRASSNWVTAAPASASHPPQVELCGLAFSSATDGGAIILFGGSNSTYGTYSGETWKWDGTQWTLAQAANSGGPSPRSVGAMAETSNGHVLLFGGATPVSQLDTWEWDGTSWQQLFPAHSPQWGTITPYLYRMVYEQHTGRTLMLRHQNDGNTPVETWAWQNGDWTLLDSSSVLPRDSQDGPHLCYDSLRHRCVYFGGWHATGAGTYVFDGTQWSALATATVPPSRSFGVMAFDPVADLAVMGPGLRTDNTIDDQSWVFSGGPLPSSNPQVGDDPRDIVAGDLDGDGHADLATADHGDDTLTILTNDGQGGFGAPGLQIDLSASGTGPTALALGDLDNDGFADDVAVTCDGTDNLLLVTNPASGSPSIVSFATLGTNPVHLACADLDSNPIDDVVIACEGDLLGGGGSLELVLNGGSPIALVAPSNQQFVRVACGDLDGDGDCDIVALVHGAVDSLLLFANDGSGAFLAAGSIAVGSSGLTGGLGCDDFDGDGDLDLAVTSTTLFPSPAQSLEVFLHTGSGALDASDYAASIPIPIGGYLGFDIATGDFDDDRIPGFATAFMDLTVVSVGSGSVTANRTFDGSTFGSSSNVTTGVNPIAAVMTDLNGDGCADLVVLDNGDHDVRIEISTTPALAQNYGSGCAGTGGLVPVIGALNATVSGATDFAVTLSNARAFAPALLLFGGAPDDQLLGSCHLLVAPPLVTALSFTSGSGTGAIGLVVPSAVSALGLDGYFQWAVFDDQGGFANLLSFSDGLRIQIGQ